MKPEDMAVLQGMYYEFKKLCDRHGFSHDQTCQAAVVVISKEILDCCGQDEEAAEEHLKQMEQGLRSAVEAGRQAERETGMHK